MPTENEIIEILNSDDPQAKYAMLDQLRVSKSSTKAIVEALEKATHDEDMGVVVRAIKALQSDVHRRMAVEVGLFGPSRVEASTTPEAGEEIPSVIGDDEQASRLKQPIEGMITNPGATPTTLAETKSESSIPLELPPPAGVFRRGAALLVDFLILAVITIAIGYLFAGALERIGYYARLITAVIAWLYFSIFNSSILAGATAGKRLMHIQVLAGRGGYLGIPTAMLRSLVLVLPILFYGWQAPGLTSNIPALILVNLFTVGLAAGIIYLAIFNSGSGQSLDDLLVGSRVVNLKGTPVEGYPGTPRIHKIGAAVTMIALSALIFGLNLALVNRFLKDPAVQNITQLYQALKDDPRYFLSGVYSTSVQGTGDQPLKMLVINLWPRQNLDDAGRQQAAQEAAALAQQKNALAEYNGLQVRIIGGYDLGFFDRSIAWLCAPPGECSTRVVRDSILRLLNFTVNYQYIQ